MTLLYIYLVFAFECKDANTIYISIDDKDKPLYQLYFKYDRECTNFQKVLHNYSMEMELHKYSIKTQLGFIYKFIETNPFMYEYQYTLSNKRK